MLPVDACDISDVVCCDSMFSIAEHLLTQVGDQLDACVAGGPCATVVRYVTMGEGDDGVTDSLTVDFVNAGPKSARNGMTVPMPVVRAAFTIRLRESGWPMAQNVGGQIIAPDPVRQNALARHAYAHGELMYRKLLSMHLKRELIPESIKGWDNALLSPLEPMRPRGGTIGFEARVEVDVPWSGGMAPKP